MPLVDSIPSLDLSDFLGSNIEKKTQFVHDLGKAFESIGFVAISNHGYHSDRQEALYHSIRTFYELPEHVKAKYDGSHTAGQRGYTGKGKEHAAGRNVGDLKEFYHIGKAIEGSDSSHYQKNIFPDEYLFTLKGTLFFNNSKFSFEIYPLTSGLFEYSMGLL